MMYTTQVSEAVTKKEVTCKLNIFHGQRFESWIEIIELERKTKNEGNKNAERTKQNENNKNEGNNMDSSGSSGW